MIHYLDFKRELGSYPKQKQDTINNHNQEENKNKSQIPYEYNVGDQFLLETQRILRKLSASCKGSYAVINVYKNGTIIIQRGILSERVYH
jgi:hypothetical protein